MGKKQSIQEFEQTVKALGLDKRKLQTFIEIFDDILGSVREPLVVLDSDLKVLKANRSFYRNFKVKPRETEGILIYDLGNRQWDIPKLRELLEDILPQNSTFDDFEVEHNFETIGRKIMHLNARRIYRELEQTQMILLSIEDVTEREYYKRHLEELVEKRTAEIRVAREEAEKGKQIAEAALLEIKKLKDQLRKKSSWNTTMRTLLVRVMGSITCSIRLNKLPAAIQSSWFLARPEPAKSWSPVPFIA
jgi:chemotaxis protein methyltransferase CheR